MSPGYSSALTACFSQINAVLFIQYLQNHQNQPKYCTQEHKHKTDIPRAVYNTNILLVMVKLTEFWDEMFNISSQASERNEPADLLRQ